MPHVLSFISDKLERFDCDNLDWVKLLPLNRNHLLHGACHYPYRKSREHPWEHGYRIRASVNIDMTPPFTYRHWGRIPSATAKQGWLSGEQDFTFSDLEQCAVHTLSHECFHFLSRSGQILDKNTEANANWWASAWLDDFSGQI